MTPTDMHERTMAYLERRFHESDGRDFFLVALAYCQARQQNRPLPPFVETALDDFLGFLAKAVFMAAERQGSPNPRKFNQEVLRRLGLVTTGRGSPLAKVGRHYRNLEIAWRVHKAHESDSTYEQAVSKVAEQIGGPDWDERTVRRAYDSHMGKFRSRPKS